MPCIRDLLAFGFRIVQTHFLFAASFLIRAYPMHQPVQSLTRSGPCKHKIFNPRVSVQGGLLMRMLSSDICRDLHSDMLNILLPCLILAAGAVAYRSRHQNSSASSAGSNAIACSSMFMRARLHCSCFCPRTTAGAHINHHQQQHQQDSSVIYQVSHRCSCVPLRWHLVYYQQQCKQQLQPEHPQLQHAISMVQGGRALHDAASWITHREHKGTSLGVLAAV